MECEYVRALGVVLGLDVLPTLPTVRVSYAGAYPNSVAIHH